MLIASCERFLEAIRLSADPSRLPIGRPRVPKEAAPSNSLSLCLISMLLHCLSSHLWAWKQRTVNQEREFKGHPSQKQRPRISKGILLPSI